MRTQALLVLLALPLAAQNVVGTASRTVVIGGPSEAVIDVSAAAPANVPFDAVLAALQPFGIRREHLTSLTLAGGVTTFPTFPPTPGPQIYNYEFSMTVTQDESERILERIQQNVRGILPGLISWRANSYLNASQAALDVNRIAQLPTLFAEASRRAGQYHQAASVPPSPVVFATDGYTASSTPTLLAGAVPALLNRGTKATYSATVRTGSGARSVSASATKLVTLSPEEATVRVSVDAMPEVTADQVLQFLAPAGFTRADLQTVVSVGSGFPPQVAPGVPTVPAPPSTATFDWISNRDAASADQILSQLDQLRRTLPRGVVALRFGLGMRVSPATIDLLRQSVVPELLAATRPKAADLAQLMGGRLGALITFSTPEPLGGVFFTPVPAVASNLRILTTVNAQYAVE